MSRMFGMSLVLAVAALAAVFGAAVATGGQPPANELHRRAHRGGRGSALRNGDQCVARPHPRMLSMRRPAKSNRSSTPTTCRATSSRRTSTWRRLACLDPSSRRLRQRLARRTASSELAPSPIRHLLQPSGQSGELLRERPHDPRRWLPAGRHSRPARRARPEQQLGRERRKGVCWGGSDPAPALG